MLGLLEVFDSALRQEERQRLLQLTGLKFPNRSGYCIYSVKQEDNWTVEEREVFLKYCEDKRIACHHAIAKDTGMRLGKIHSLKISDLHFIINSSTVKNKQNFDL